MERGDNTLLFMKLASHSVSVLLSEKEGNLRKIQLYAEYNCIPDAESGLSNDFVTKFN